VSYGLGVDLGTTFTAAACGNAQYQPAPQAQQTVTVNSPLALSHEVPPVHRSAALVTHAASDRPAAS
jgi:hypothetical protein